MGKIRIAIITTDNREPDWAYGETLPRFAPGSTSVFHVNGRRLQKFDGPSGLDFIAGRFSTR